MFSVRETLATFKLPKLQGLPLIWLPLQAGFEEHSLSDATLVEDAKHPASPSIAQRR